MRRASPVVTTFGLIIALVIVAECVAKPEPAPPTVVASSSTSALSPRPQLLIYMPGGKQVLPADPSAILQALDVLLPAISTQVRTFYTPERYSEAFGALSRLEAVYPSQVTLATLTGPIQADRVAVVRTEDGLRILTETGVGGWAMWGIRAQDTGLFAALVDEVERETGVRLDRPPSALSPTPAPAPAPTPVPGPFIEIQQPVAGATLLGQVTVRGRAGGLFENTFALELRDAAGHTLALLPVTVPAGEMGQVGDFEAVLTWTPPDRETSGLLLGTYRSPKDGAIVAEDAVEVILAPAK